MPSAKVKRMRALLGIRKCLSGPYASVEERSKAVGDVGERIAIAALRTYEPHFEIVSQAVDTKGTVLASRGGKRPDFICAKSACPDAPAYCVDAKFTKTDFGTRFLISQVELAQYRALQDYVESDVLLLVIPQELDGKIGFWVRLDEVADCNDKIGGKTAAVATLDRLPPERKIQIDLEQMPSEDEFRALHCAADELYRRDEPPSTPTGAS